MSINLKENLKLASDLDRSNGSLSRKRVGDYVSFSMLDAVSVSDKGFADSELGSSREMIRRICEKVEVVKDVMVHSTNMDAVTDVAYFVYKNSLYIACKNAGFMLRLDSKSSLELSLAIVAIKVGKELSTDMENITLIGGGTESSCYTYLRYSIATDSGTACLKAHVLHYLMFNRDSIEVWLAGGVVNHIESSKLRDYSHHGDYHLNAVENLELLACGSFNALAAKYSAEAGRALSFTKDIKLSLTSLCKYLKLTESAVSVDVRGNIVSRDGLSIIYDRKYICGVCS